MQGVMIALRSVHIVLGVFWVGAVLFINTLLAPSLKAAGPAGGRVMQELRQRRYQDVLTVVASLAILSGLGLLWLDSGGLQRVWLGAPIGIAFCVGGVAGILAFLVGIIVIRPRVIRIDELERELTEAQTEALRNAHLQRMGVLRQELMAWGRGAAVLLVVAVGAMATARYL